ncbi:hypothetical protein C6P40_002139 [Pichia californica]|uniref:AAA protein C-terminal winged helix domain-containing protein n=1 Tax=Pichia californica TaxID=460514 RepID=A0A9P6WPA9_9ASCO|nr:hypothetical protein C6P42_001394 [[Candida] californica]KAG0690640.1 hypothetical protein C6P40_002139 [[Candida] californica]
MIPEIRFRGGMVIQRQFHQTLKVSLNPLLPIDPTEIITEIERDDKKDPKKEEVTKVKGRIKSIHIQKRTTTDGTKGNKGKSGNNGNENGSESPNDNENDRKEKEKRRKNFDKITNVLFKCTEAGLITLASLGVLVLGGILYHKIYKQNVLWKMDSSFEKNESLILLKHQDSVSNLDKDLWAERSNQELIDSIINGRIKGKYYLLLGEKGTGKTSTVMEGINRVQGKDCVIIDCSSDVELMRLRIGNALNFEFFEDYIGSLFSMKGPRESVPILDVERAFMKLEKVLIDRRNKTNKPLIMVFNNSHLIDSSLVELLQQKAENFSSSGMMTVMFISDDYWLFEKMKSFATRLQVINFEDTKLDQASKILKCSRIKNFKKSLTDEECATVYNLIGGRPQHLFHVASQKDMILAAQQLIDNEKLWFLNNCALLGADMDDDVMESGKFATSAMLLMRELVEMDRKRKENSQSDDIIDVVNLPQLPLWRARQVMTRPDYIEKYDKMNIFTIGTDSNVRADSVPMMRAFHEIASHSDFDSTLRETIDRISEIESLGRTREIVFKDLTHGGRFKIQENGDKCTKIITVEENEESEESKIETESNNSKTEDISHFNDYHHEGERKKWWKRRLEAYSHSSKGDDSKGAES